MAKALALYSGGLDSILAILTMIRQGVPVTAVTFLTGFGCYQAEIFREAARNASQLHGFELIARDITPQFIDIVRSPKFGYGKNMNPCLDCKILMLREAKKILTEIAADFVVTGEVLFQRPMSQRRDTLSVLDRESELKGLVLRPLSAKLMKPTVPELSGMVDREQLHGIHGRSRKPQIALAEAFGLTVYPQPAGGCLLTDPTYAVKLRQMMDENPEVSPHDVGLLRVGRHFRLTSGAKVIVGRDDRDNTELEKLLPAGALQLFVNGYGSPLTAILGEADEEAIKTAAALTARYSAARKLPLVAVTCLNGAVHRVVDVAPASDETIERFRA
jgi:hypothetical protein